MNTTQAEQEIFNLLHTETSLRSKRELIEQFIRENLPDVKNKDEVQPAFDKYWSEEKQKAFTTIVQEENLSIVKTQKLIEDYLFAERAPLRDEILALIEGEKRPIAAQKIRRPHFKTYHGLCRDVYERDGRIDV